MFELMLMRHAKSDWHSNTADIDRPLNNRGRRDSERIGAYLNQINSVPDKMVVSSACRTRETAEILINIMAVSEDVIVVDKALYLADWLTMVEVIEQHAQENQRLLILAHNPGMDDLVSYLSHESPQLSDNGKLMTTCAIACFTLSSPGDLKQPGLAKLKEIVRPKDIFI